MAKRAKELKRILDLIDAQHADGFSWREARNGHILVNRNGQRVAVLASTPSDWRAWKNGIADLRRAGVNIPH